MGRPGLSLDKKFRRLAHDLDDFQAGFGRILARGSLELLWDSAYESCTDELGDAFDVEAAAEWRGPPGRLVKALLEAGGPGKAGFIEAGGSEWWPDGPKETYRVHDLWDHAPEYARKRVVREEEREKKGKTIKEMRAEAGRKGAARTNAKRTASGQPASSNIPANVATLADQTAATIRPLAGTPAPAPAPAPAPEAAAAARVAAEDAPRQGVPPRAAEAHTPAARESGVESQRTGAVPPRAAPVPAETPARRLEVVDEAGGAEDGHPFPLVEPFREALMLRCARTVPHPVGGQGAGGNAAVFEACQRALEVIGEAEAVRLCHERVVEAVKRRDRQPGTLRFFVECVLGDELTRRASQPKPARKCIGEDDNGQPIWETA